MTDGQGPDWRGAFPALAADADARVAAIMDAARPVSLPAGRTVFDWGTPCLGFMMLLEGSVRVYLLAENGRVVTLYHVRGGDTCVLTTSCLLAAADYPAIGVTESDVHALLLDPDAFERALADSAAFRRFVFDGFGRRLADVLRRMESVTFGAIDQRLAAALVTAGADSQVLALTHEHLARELGSAREVVSRHLKRFEARGWVALRRGRVELLDTDALDALAGNRR